MLPIPGGWFWMGAAEDPPAAPAEAPGRRVFVAPFFIDRVEVTNADFGRFVAASGHVTRAERDGFSRGFEDGQFVANIPGASWRAPRGRGRGAVALPGEPVIVVSWDDAAAYCAWAGKRLPTEAEWERAARGADARPYPWGWDAPAGDRVNLADRRNGLIPWAESGLDDGFERLAPAGSFPRGASPYGVLDMAGNAAEWVHDRFGPYDPAAVLAPAGPAAGERRVLRGGSYNDNAGAVRTTRRAHDLPTYHSGDTGVRCAMDGPRVVLPRLERWSVVNTPRPTLTATRTPSPSPTRTATPSPTPTPTRRGGRPDACDRGLGQTYRDLDIERRANRAPQDDPEVNLSRRGWKPVDQPRQLVRICGETDRDAPQLDRLFGDDRPPRFTSTHVVFTHDGPTGGRTERYPWPVHLAGLAASPGEVVELPWRRPDIDSGTVHALLLYADDDSLTFKYTRDDAIRAEDRNGYAVHLEGVCPGPELLSAYQRLRAGFAARAALPAIASDQPIGRAIGSEVLVTVRDTGSFMDPRSGKDWWQSRWSEPPCAEAWDGVGAWLRDAYDVANGGLQRMSR